MTSIPRAEYPRPQFVRPDWRCLNGEWEFAYDPGGSGRARGMFRGRDVPSRNYPMKITVPFCPESALSGIGNRDFMRCVWYRRAFDVPDAWREANRRVILHIDGCDWRSEVWLNGVSVGEHIGGYVGFAFDITEQLAAGENFITLCAEDDTEIGRQAVGKQSLKYDSHLCFYTRTTGIWQSVWLECVPAAHLNSVRFTPLTDRGAVLVQADCEGAEGMTLEVSARYRGRDVGRARGRVAWRSVSFELPLSEIHLWDLGRPELYDVTLQMGEDRVESYFGLRDVCVDGKKFKLNGRTVFQRLVLDQGFYPDGIITSPSDEALMGDIRRAMDMGFTGARLHMKMFEPRYLYHADQMGFMVWAESAASEPELIFHPDAWQALLPDWLSALQRDYNHPAIIGWCCMNETGGKVNKTLFQALYDLTRLIDPTRPVIDSSGHAHCATDIFDAHESGGTGEDIRRRYAPLSEGKDVTEGFCSWLGLSHLPERLSFISEYGGITWNPEGAETWGYGDEPETEEEFLSRYEGMVRALYENPGLCGACYIQLTDVEQERNGLYYYDRRPKFDPEKIRRINRLPAAIENTPDE